MKAELSLNYLSRCVLRVTLGVLTLLLIPFLGMYFTTEIQWSLFDFLVAAGLAFEFILLKFKSRISRVIFISGLIIFFFLIWAELSVGIFGTPFAGN
ncbi:hypothetical protein [Psychroflexus aestuariivivens]|uniref:hypothetical protein n=1 Tax=Psychroflexus aestuariivivens TaxID=1795040 RepID=UPI001F0287DD|nr:hypothetical protein [Psychroflexus aestuariivivens]